MIEAKKSEPPVQAAGQLRISAAPLVEATISPTAQKITEVLQYRHVCHVLNDLGTSTSFPTHIAIDQDRVSRFSIKADGPINPLLFGCSMTVTDMTVFLRMLASGPERGGDQNEPSLIKDLVLLESPVLLNESAFDKLGDGLAVFRNVHPHAAVVVGNPADSTALLQMETLRDKGLVDEVGSDAKQTFTQLLLRGAVILEKKLEALALAMQNGNVAVHCNPSDAHETVIIEQVK